MKKTFHQGHWLFDCVWLIAQLWCLTATHDIPLEWHLAAKKNEQELEKTPAQARYFCLVIFDCPPSLFADPVEEDRLFIDQIAVAVISLKMHIKGILKSRLSP